MWWQIYIKISEQYILPHKGPGMQKEIPFSDIFIQKK